MLKNLLLLSGFSTFVVIIVVAFTIYHNSLLPTLSSNTQHHTTAITPTFDKKTLDTLKKRTPLSVNLEEKSSIISEDSKSTSTNTIASESANTKTYTLQASTSANTLQAPSASPFAQ